MNKKLLAIGIIGCCLFAGLVGFAIGNTTGTPRTIKSNDISIMHVVDDIYVMYSNSNVTTFKLIDNQEIN